MRDPVLWLGLVTAAVWLGGALYLGRGLRRIDFLEEIPRLGDSDLPSVTICVAARNEERDVERGIRSALSQDYPEFEVVAVNDRSTDDTGRILDRLEGESDGALRVVHLEELPDGWIGKNHALHRAAQEARGELLLFVDADVAMDPDALGRAASRMVGDGYDQLTAVPERVWPHGFLRAVGALFSLGMIFHTRAWRLEETGPERAAGIGAFYLVRREAYRKAGGHRAVARRPDDDMALARALKAAGARSHFLFARELVRVPWYRSVRNFVGGVSRASFATMGYSVPRSLAVSAGTVLLCVWPWVGAVLVPGPARWANLAAVAVMAGLFLATRREIGARAVDALWWPLASLLLAYVAVYSAVLILVQGGIVWRGTFYPLEMLREEDSGGC